MSIEINASVLMEERKHKECANVRYNGETVVFYDLLDGRLNAFMEVDALAYRGTDKVVSQCGSNRKHQLRRDKDDYLVFNPPRLDGLIQTKNYGWFAIKCALEQHNLEINTKWDPIPLRELVDKSLKSDSVRKIFLVQSTKVPGYNENRSKAVIVPLLDLIIHICPEHHGLSLRRIGARKNGADRFEFENVEYLMLYLFEQFREEFIGLCKIEFCPIHLLHTCDFNATYKYDGQKRAVQRTIYSRKFLKKVNAVPVSALISEKIYGNIPWLITDTTVPSVIKVLSYNLPFCFYEAGTNYDRLPKAIYFETVIIFSDMDIDGVHYTEGSFIGIEPIVGTRRAEFHFRGELFSTMSLKEELMLEKMLEAFHYNQLKYDTDLLTFYRMHSMNEQQSRVRPAFIRRIQEEILEARGDPKI
jgi:hypothetical protein